MTIPINSIMGYIGLALLVFGAFMVLAGFDVISIQQVTVRKGKKTWILGIVFALLGIWLLLPELGTTAPATSSFEPSESMPVTTAVSNPLPSSKDVSGSPIAFNIPNNDLWNQSSDRSYTVTGNEDTIAWSDMIVDGDLELSFDIQFQEPNGEGGIIFYGNGIGLSDEQLFFGFGPVHSKIMAGTPYDSRYLDDVWMTDVDVNKKHSIIIRIVNRKASLFFDNIRWVLPQGNQQPGHHRRSGCFAMGASHRNGLLASRQLSQEISPLEHWDASRTGGLYFNIIIWHG